MNTNLVDTTGLFGYGCQKSLSSLHLESQTSNGALLKQNAIVIKYSIIPMTYSIRVRALINFKVTFVRH